MVGLRTLATPCTGVDYAEKSTDRLLDAVVAAGHKFVTRYVPLPGNAPGWDCEFAEAQGIMRRGLGLMLVQHVRKQGWYPRDHSGADDGAFAASYAKRVVGYPTGAHIALDLEGIHPSIATGSIDTARFADDWARSVIAGGFPPCLYVGYDVPLTADQLWELPNFHLYWSDAGPRRVPNRGFALKQLLPSTLAGTPVDVDQYAPDLLGGKLIVACAA